MGDNTSYADEALLSDKEEKVRRWPFLLAAAYLLVVLGVGIALYPSASDPMPVHFDAALQPDAWGPKTLIGFVFPVLIASGVVALMWVLVALMPRLARLGEPRDAETTAVQLSPRPPSSAETTRLSRRMLENVGLSAALLIGTIALLTWFGVPSWAASWAFGVLVGGFLAVVAVSVVGIVRSERRMYAGG